ncbi:VOC family protein [Mycolicibacterium neworleansense]|uniref:Quinone binding protein n=1 Tax=Mycolicibacterium neworleansense TaxID=146018 RepID=A0A0H5RYH8_9MYCO|nr:VOC family protein [Mycolicibacterium neworleansense]MCV7363643.1 VOC family protein [Mycolicibacterium neworleansense]CRZ18988.1 quinone binding protein [Mycolicibacterium neworleansense]
MALNLNSAVIEIVTADLPRSLDFYRLLGLDVPQPDGPHVEVALPGGNRLAFDTEEVIAGMHPGWTPPSGPGRVALAFGLDAPGDVDALYERLTAAGHPGTLKPFDAPWGQRYATVEDPDGTSVDLFAALRS